MGHPAPIQSSAVLCVLCGQKVLTAEIAKEFRRVRRENPGAENLGRRGPGAPRPATLLHCFLMAQESKQPARGFASDNNAGVHPEVLEAIGRANEGHVVAYGDDRFTRSAIAKFEEHFGAGIDVFFTFNGTGANVLSLQALNRPYHAVLCSEYAHIYTDECGAPEKHTGCKLIALPHQDGKITLDSVRHAYHGIGDQHHVQVRVISITQSTEMGTVYQPEEIHALARFAHEHEMFLHVDGARIANAAASLGQTLRQATRDLGVDVLSFGGTKNGILGGEAVVFFNRELSPDFLYLRKQGMQLASKMRFVGAQFEALLTNDLWRRSAEHANRMARVLEAEVRKIPQVRVVWKVEANGVFAQIPRPAIAKIEERYFFYPWIEEECIVRWMCSFDTTEDDVREFVKVVAEAVKG
jgi:threonine aldolase